MKIQKEGNPLASIYTDESREQRYGRLRRKKKKCEKALDILMWITLLVGALDLIPQLFSGVLKGLFAGQLGEFFGVIFSAVSAAAAVYAIYAKKWTHTLGAILVIAVSSAIGMAISGGLVTSSGYIVLLIPVLIVDRIWAGLEQEEGFPLFDISYAERGERSRNLEKLTEARALRAGYRIAQTEQTSDMPDLLDSGRDAPVAAAHPHGYQERFYGSAAENAPAEEIRSGIMDTLEELSGSAKPSATGPAPAADRSQLPVLGDMGALPESRQGG